MNTAEAIAHLRKIGYAVFEQGDKFDIHQIGAKQYCPSCYEWDWRWIPKQLYTARELVKFAKRHSSEDDYRATAKMLVKSSNGKRRTKDREILSSKDFDKIDELSYYRESKEDDIWNYD